jgi:formyl-CoA transferase
MLAVIGALDDVVVLDLTTTFWGSMGAALLGDFGAAVVRVEHPDPSQRRFVDVDDEHEPGTWNYRFDLANRNKRSVAIDVESEAGGEIVRALAAKADVVVTDRSHDWLASRKLDYASASAARSDVVYVRGSTLGPQGTEEPPLDEIAAARTGMMPILPQPGEPPVYPGHGQMYTAVMIAFGATAALLHRRATGEGQQVDTSLLAGNMYGASLDLQAFLAIGGERFLHPVSRLDAGNPMSGTQYPTSDGLWVTLTMPDTDRWWPVLAEIAGLDAADPRFEDHDKRCGEHRLVLMEILDQAFRKHPADHWRAIFNERQISADVIETYDYPVADPVTRENRYILDLDDPSLGPTSLLGFPIYMTDTPAWLDRTAARLGQHSAEVLRELLEYSPARITELIDRGVVA